MLQAVPQHNFTIKLLPIIVRVSWIKDKWWRQGGKVLILSIALLMMKTFVSPMLTIFHELYCLSDFLSMIIIITINEFLLNGCLYETEIWWRFVSQTSTTFQRRWPSSATIHWCVELYCSNFQINTYLNKLIHRLQNQNQDLGYSHFHLFGGTALAYSLL